MVGHVLVWAAVLLTALAELAASIAWTKAVPDINGDDLAAINLILLAAWAIFGLGFLARVWW